MLSSLLGKSTVTHQTNAIIMNASEEAIFEAAANLEAWPTFLPHYRYIHYYERGPVRNLVKMAAYRSFIPIAWASEQIIDRERREIHFKHLKAWTKGMNVIWRFRRLPAGVHVEIVHDFSFRVPLLAPLAERVICGFFINFIATQTLQYMRAYVEKK